MTRPISPSLAGVLERLELDQPELVTGDDLARLMDEVGLRTPMKVVASQLRNAGWLLATGRRGVWEFAPASMAGPHSRHDPVTPLRAFLSQRPSAPCALTFSGGRLDARSRRPRSGSARGRRRRPGAGPPAARDACRIGVRPAPGTRRAPGRASAAAGERARAHGRPAGRGPLLGEHPRVLPGLAPNSNRMRSRRSSTDGPQPCAPAPATCCRACARTWPNES